MSGSGADYLTGGLLADGGLRADLATHVPEVAGAWLAAGVEADALNVLAELLARLAVRLPAAVRFDALAPLIEQAGVAEPVQAWLRVALEPGLDADSVAALAVHLVDIAERMAVDVYVAELPAMTAKSDRSGEAARRVGAARRLRG